MHGALETLGAAHPAAPGAGGRERGLRGHAQGGSVPAPPLLRPGLLPGVPRHPLFAPWSRQLLPTAACPPRGWADPCAVACCPAVPVTPPGAPPKEPRLGVGGRALRGCARSPAGGGPCSQRCSPQHCFRMPQSLGVIGGKPNSAHYFIGYVGEWGSAAVEGRGWSSGCHPPLDMRPPPRGQRGFGGCSGAALPSLTRPPPTQGRSSSTWTPTPHSRPWRPLTAARSRTRASIASTRPAG